MIKQYFIAFEDSAICSTIWFGTSSKKILILPSVALRSMAGIRYYTSILASSLNKLGYNVITFDYPGTGNSEGDIVSVGIMEMLNASEKVFDFIEEKFESPIDFVIGLAAGNMIAPMLQRRKKINQTILLNPDFDCIHGFYEGMDNGINDKYMDSTSLGYFESDFTTDNGSDATFTVLNMENPSYEVRFWDALIGPFYGGESEIVSYKLVQELRKVNIIGDLSDFQDQTVVFYWGNWFPDSQLTSQCVDMQYIDCGRLTNENYWVESSQLFDQTIKIVCDYLEVPVLAEEFNKEAVMERLEKYTKYELNDNVFVQTFSIITRGKSMVGLLYGPSTDSDSVRPIVIYEHGLCCDNVGEYRAWYILSCELARKGYYSLRYDHIGSGVSGGEFDETSYDNYVNDLKSLINWCKDINLKSNGKIIMISWSFGANISLMMASNEPRIDRIILWSPVIENGTATTKIKFYRNNNGNIVFPISPLWLPSEFLISEKALDMKSINSQVVQPTLLVTGEKDNEVLYQPFVEKIANRVCDTHVMIRNAGHCFSMHTIKTVIGYTISWIEGEERRNDLFD
ncbi:Alpha/beta hydrolase family protein [compost metagenome]